MKKQTNSLKIISIIISCFTVILLVQGCNKKPSPPKVTCTNSNTKQETCTIEIPKQTRLVSFFDGENVIFFDKLGNQLKPCQLCTVELEKRYGANCQKADERSNICKGLTSTTIRDVVNVSFIKSTGSECNNASSEGNFVSKCYDLCESFGICP